MYSRGAEVWTTRPHQGDTTYEARSTRKSCTRRAQRLPPLMWVDEIAARLARIPLDQLEKLALIVQLLSEGYTLA